MVATMSRLVFVAALVVLAGCAGLTSNGATDGRVTPVEISEATAADIEMPAPTGASTSIG